MKSAVEIFGILETSTGGLDSSVASERMVRYGKNELTAKPSIPKWRMFLYQFKDVLVILLMVAAFMSLLIGNFNDALIMGIIVMVNASIGYFQENKAENIMDSLKKLVQSPSKAYRDGELKEIIQTDLVPGDVIYLEEGDKIPADIRIMEAFNFRTNDFSLTGESMPQEKNSDTLQKQAILADRDNMAYLGTTVASGNAKGIVVWTGMETELGKIADMTQEEDTSSSPLQIEMRVIANSIAVFAVFIGVALFGISISQGLGMNFALIYGLGIAVAVVPQALPMQVTVALSNGVGRLAKKNAVIRKLSSVETLGSTNVIATDKTGTLTKNEMTVKHLWFDGKEYELTGIGYQPKGGIKNSEGRELTKDEIGEIEIMLDAATMASNAEIHEPDENHTGWYAIGDPTEAAMVAASTKLGTRSPNEDEENPELYEFSFDSVRKRMSSVRQFGDRKVLTMKGAMDSVLEVSNRIYRNGESVPMTESDIKHLKDLNVAYSQKAMRVLAIAYRELGKDESDYVLEDMERNVVFLGLMAMTDPPKEGVREAMEKAHDAHIRTFIMTGDHAITAQAIGHQVALSKDGSPVDVVTGQELDEMDDDALDELMGNNESLIFSRVSPENKLRIVKILKGQDQIVAVTGDGVNDAPALKSAHIGVAMGGIGTDVSKEAADLILLDDSYSTMVYAIREGRTIYNNLKKTILASLTSNGAELSVVLLGLMGVAFFGWPIPILAIQILAIDLLAEILPLTALTFDPGSDDIMTSPPRSRKEHILNKKSMTEILSLGFIMGLLGFINFGLFINRMGVDMTSTHALYARATTISYATIVLCQFMNVLSRRYTYESFFSYTFFTNKKILLAVLFSIGLTIAAIYTPFINSFIGFAPLSIMDWTFVTGAAMVFLAVHETIKAFKRSRRAIVDAD
jgi:Ca2+-transporting ATPase